MSGWLAMIFGAAYKKRGVEKERSYSAAARTTQLARDEQAKALVDLECSTNELVDVLKNKLKKDGNT